MRPLFRVLTVSVALLAATPALARGPLVLAAASLQESMNAAADAWAAQRHERPVISFGGSSALARQIEAGAPADLFVSADEDWMNALARKGAIVPASRVTFLGNRLVLVAPAAVAKPVTIKRGFALAQWLGSGRLAMADGAVPAGKYGQKALTALGVWSAVAPKVARGDTVRSALALVERGAAPYGIVYATDAYASKRVRIVGVFPAASHPPITYPVAVLKAAPSPAAAEGFRRFLVSSAGKAIFRRYGFVAR
ncbi:molybdate ABC transporter substrate-binding protein [Sphingomonas glacialis]|uniref:Molybdate ABC transporter substrate-binding protein n=1 Tax=Sphingomonas glacialis TaxID=658225 RepID=A0ABQ3LA69_9SPHN|nr:molybdate ABC transporter substrate-binding protein [Sphingomonas glacialis]GHH09581.1 molybdate ABC transporter substrate-binding protein [Sphingomonas glacialis]